MSVLRKQMTVYSTVITLLALTHVAVMLVTDYFQMVGAVMVNSYVCPLKIIRLMKHTDIIECAEGRANCQQLCINTIGSFTCACSAGFRLATDGHNCNGQSVLSHTGELKLLSCS